jgi:exo-beta-1,3-glucanase (GH17 family)
MTFRELLGFEPGPAICYSGYREGQSPDARVYPSYEEIREDLTLVARRWRFIRLYDCQEHAERVLEVIRREGLALKVLLGAWLAAEADNPACPWGGVHGPERLARNREANRQELARLVALSRAHPGAVAAVAVGNEACVGWTDHLVPPARVAAHVREVKAELRQPVTVCDNHVPWRGAMDEVAAAVDFISIHTYPVWERRGLPAALEVTEENWRSVAERFPGKPVAITEAGWTTRADGKAIPRENASEELQAGYLAQLDRWIAARGVLTFVFEAFDEPWKGSADADEPEKHWGLFTVDRRPKLAVRTLYPELAGGGTP